MSITRTKKALLTRLESALNNLYHNATPHYPSGMPQELWDNFQDWFNNQAEFEIEYIQDGLGCSAKEYKKAQRQGFTHNERYFWLVQRITEFGKLYTYGRGGRTLAPNDLISQRGGSGFSIKRADSFEDYSNERLTDMIQVIEAFNDYVEKWNSKENLQSMYNEDLQYQRAELASEAKATRKELKRLARDTLLIAGVPDSVCDVLKDKMKRLKADHKGMVHKLALYNEVLTA